jgi:succinate dehydrogenase / fumarate reductase iron-sulfur subunit/fumarate reductase iron-sulfur subunit
LSSQEIKARIFRYDPEQDVEPRFDVYTIPVIKNMAILDVVFHVQNYIDKSLALSLIHI